jgi:hypothetical protein
MGTFILLSLLAIDNYLNIKERDAFLFPESE